MLRDDSRFLVIYASILSIQFHPANGVIPSEFKTAATVVSSYDAAVVAFNHMIQQEEPCGEPLQVL